MSGPLPDPDAIRRNAPTIPTTKLPAGGRRGRVPRPPRWIPLGKAGKAWWTWAWRTPEACAWDDGQLVKIAHRASLEDDLAAIGQLDLDGFLDDVLRAADAREVKVIVAHLAGLVTGRLGILQKISDLDDRLGLSPKGRDQLRLKVVADSDYYPAEPPAAPATGPGSVTPINERRRRSVDAS